MTSPESFPHNNVNDEGVSRKESRWRAAGYNKPEEVPERPLFNEGSTSRHELLSDIQSAIVRFEKIKEVMEDLALLMRNDSEWQDTRGKLAERIESLRLLEAQVKSAGENMSADEVGRLREEALKLTKVGEKLVANEEMKPVKEIPMTRAA